jgi:hypothetical protein
MTEEAGDTLQVAAPRLSEPHAAAYPYVRTVGSSSLLYGLQEKFSEPA